MPDDHDDLIFRYAVRSHTGLRRHANEDAAYAGARLLAVADGTGDWCGATGEAASAAAIEAFRPLDTQIPASQVLDTLNRAFRKAGSTLRDMASKDPTLQKVGTTLTAIVASGSQLGLVHIGDSRAYLLRADEFSQLTEDHTLLQLMVDIGKMTADEVAARPQRGSMLVRVLAANGDYEADLQLRELHAGDRYLLCTDGLHEVQADDDLAQVVRTVTDPDEAARQLVALAIAAGGTDDVTCIVADVAPNQVPGSVPG